MKAFDIKKGNVVEHNGGVYQIRDIERSSPQGRGGNVRFRFIMYSVPGGNKLDASFDGDDNLTEVELLRRQATFSYKDGDAFVFMDDEDYTPYTLDPAALGDAAGYITGNTFSIGSNDAPLSMYFNEGRVKVELALAKGKQDYDKRQDIARRTAERELVRELGRRVKGMRG